MMIRKLVLTISTIFTVLLSLNTVQAAEWTADFVMVDGQERHVSKVFIKGDKRREEMMHRGQTESIVLFNPGSHQIITLMPSERMFMEIPMSPDQEMFSKGPGSDLASGKPLGTEKVSGYLCDKYHQESAEGAVTVWLVMALPAPITAPFSKLIQNAPGLLERIFAALGDEHHVHGESIPSSSATALSVSIMKSKDSLRVRDSIQARRNSCSSWPAMAEINAWGRITASLIKSAASNTRPPRLVLPCSTANPWGNQERRWRWLPIRKPGSYRGQENDWPDRRLYLSLPAQSLHNPQSA
nr:DUF4412 domain-containing protein [endosymbiont of Lamellibrachia barhami]